MSTPTEPCGAYLSEDRKYRFWLSRVWDLDRPMMAVIGVNPSTADETQDDPTIRKVIGFARRLEYGGVLMLNLAAYRATNPRECQKAYNPIGIFNSASHLKQRADELNISLVVAAWGKNGNAFPNQVRDIVNKFPLLWCWGKNSDGTPRHPLMLPYGTTLEKYP